MYGMFVLLLIITVSSIPVIIVYVWFRIAKYQFTLVRFLLVMIIGAAAFFPALILQNLINFTLPSGGKLELFYHVFIRIALTEELSRLLALSVYLFIAGGTAGGEFNGISAGAKGFSEKPVLWTDIKKGAAAGLIAGLGFAILESAVYAASDINVLLLRTVTAAPLHAACGSRVGTAAVMLRTNPFQAVFRILSATAIHGIYNIMISAGGFSSILAILIAFSALLSSITIISRNSGKKEENLFLNP
jgi:RsiW-degrading membrane proteinase PrsW (M82 family)